MEDILSQFEDIAENDRKIVKLEILRFDMIGKEYFGSARWPLDISEFQFLFNGNRLHLLDSFITESQR